VGAAFLSLCLLCLTSSTGFAQEDESDVGEEPRREILDEMEEGLEPDLDEDLEPELEFEAEELKGAPTEGVEEITVTGEVLESSTQADTQAITTFDQAELDTLGIADVDTLALNTPSLHVGQVGNQAVITLRGIGLENLTSVGEAGVGFAVDGVHMGRPSAANAAFFDLERVDVERGPQGILGGRNLTGGKIQLWSKKPTEDFESFGDFEYGNYDTYVTRGVVNLPIYEDKLMTRTSVLWTRHDGYQRQKFTGVTGTNADDSKDFAGRFQARSLWLDQTLEVRGIGTYSQQKGRGPALKLLGDPPSLINATVGLARSREQNGLCEDCFDRYIVDCPNPSPTGYLPEICNAKADRRTYQNEVNSQDNDQKGFTGTINWDMPFFLDTPLSDMRFGMIGSYQENNTRGDTDFDGTNWPDAVFFQKRDATQHSIEVFLERPDIGIFDFKVGFFYYKEDIDTDVCFDGRGSSTVGDLGLQAAIKTESKAGFGTFGIRPLDEVRFFAGVRYTDEEKKADQINEEYDSFQTGDVLDNTVDSRSGLTNASQDGCGRQNSTALGFSNEIGTPGNLLIGESTLDSADDSWTAWTPGVGVDWQVTPDSTLGFSATRGFKAGGFPLGTSTLNPDLQDAYPPEKVWEFELTSKNEFLDGLLRLNTTLFWTEYDPFQICQFSGPVFFCRADGGATIRGIELEFLANPIDGLQLNGFFNVLDSRINDFQIIDPTSRSCDNLASVDQIEACKNGAIGSPPQPDSPALPDDVSGNQLPKAPKWAGSFGAQYTIDLGRFGFLTPRAQTQFQGRTYFRVFNKQDFSQDKFIKVDLKMTWRSEDDRFWSEFFVTNVTDVNVINSMFVGPQGTGGQVLAQMQPPRTFGARVGINYVSDWVDRWF
jgi:iron complex outermembrane receptor protein